jgi:hypothetical protein
MRPQARSAAHQEYRDWLEDDPDNQLMHSTIEAALVAAFIACISVNFKPALSESSQYHVERFGLDFRQTQRRWSDNNVLWY